MYLQVLVKARGVRFLWSWAVSYTLWVRGTKPRSIARAISPAPLAIQLWTDYLTFPGLSFLLCEVRIIIQYFPHSLAGMIKMTSF